MRRTNGKVTYIKYSDGERSCEIYFQNGMATDRRLSNYP